MVVGDVGGQPGDTGQHSPRGQFEGFSPAAARFPVLPGDMAAAVFGSGIVELKIDYGNALISVDVCYCRYRCVSMLFDLFFSSVRGSRVFLNIQHGA